MAGAFFAGAFLAGAFLAGAFFAGAFLAGAFAAATAPALFNLGAGATPRAMSLKPLSAVILATVFAAILMVAPVAGLRPMRAGRLILANFAKPERLTTSPLATLAKMTSIVPSTAWVAVFLSIPVWSDTAWMRSRFFMSVNIFHENASVVDFR